MDKKRRTRHNATRGRVGACTRAIMSRRIAGIYVNHREQKGTFRYATLVWDVNYSDGTSETRSGRPLYEHEDGGPEWPLLIQVASAIWGTLAQILEKHENKQ
jgi:hypothetical protein